MKKISLLLTLATMVATTASAAVTPEWHKIGKHASGTDIKGKTINTADTLASGKAMVICYGATWCPYCWRFCKNGNMKAIHEQLGDKVAVIWAESDPDTPESTLTDSKLGNWTVDANGVALPYSIINDHTFASLINYSIKGFPTVVFFSPTGYYCHIYDKSWGISIDTGSDFAVSQINALLDSYPRAGQKPQIAINGQQNVIINNTYTYEVEITSVDEVSSVTWQIDGATPSAGTGSSVSTTWANGGTYNVTCSVTNTTGTTSSTLTVIAREEWQWDNVISYCGDKPITKNIGLGGTDKPVSWGIMIPAKYLKDRNCLTEVQLYAKEKGSYKLNIYQGGDQQPQTLVYTSDFEVNTIDKWQTVPLNENYKINSDLPLWVTFRTENLAHPIAMCEPAGDYNSEMINTGSQWLTLTQLTGGSTKGSWMIKAITSPVSATLDSPVGTPDSGDRKILHNGRLVILHNGKRYSPSGNEL